IAAMSLSVTSGNLSAMLFDDAITNTQPKASALANHFRGIERFKNAIRFFDPWPRVVERNNNLILSRAHSYFEAPRLGFRFWFLRDFARHSVKRIGDDVEKDLLQLVRVSEDPRHVVLDFPF